MIIDARQASDPKHGRPFSTLNAIRRTAEKMEVGESVLIESVIDQLGEEVPLANWRGGLNLIKGNRRFATRVAVDGSGVTVHRLA